jgi:hypothetical protein
VLSVQIVVFCWVETICKVCLHNLASSSLSTTKMVATCFSETSGSHLQVYTASEGRSPQSYSQKRQASLQAYLSSIQACLSQKLPIDQRLFSIGLCSWVRHIATSRKVAGSSPDEVESFQPHYGPGVDSAS